MDIDSHSNGTTVSLAVVNFAKGPRYARQIGARFDGATKTWTVHLSDRNRPTLRAPGAYGLKIVAVHAVATPVEAAWMRDPSYAEVIEAEADRDREMRRGEIAPEVG
jgi:hypothetical protein